ncbi:MAG: PGF-pre-PGF domain-containing protein [Candidatus Altiarchaeota archaeon]|nr:PGF-pre-PGF domain-containing protein [Candidatus Altiarchaeota archaeon]
MKKILLTLALTIVIVSAMTVTTEQTGADAGKIMKGELFSVTASGWNGDCTSANIDFSECPVCSLQNEETVKSISGQSVFWSSVVSSQTASNQKITVSLSGCSPPESETSSGFQVILPPELKATVSPTSFSDPSGSKQISLTVENLGDNSAQDVYATISWPSGMSTSDSASQNLGDISGGSSIGTAWIISFTDPSSSTITIQVSSSNIGTTTKTVPISVTTPDDDQTTSSSGVGSSRNFWMLIWDSEIQINVTKDSFVKIETNKTLAGMSFDGKTGTRIVIRLKTSFQNPPEIKKTYKYVEIEPEGEISNISLKFAIKKSWLNDLNKKKEHVVIMKLKDEIWTQLNREYVGEDSENYYFEVHLDSLSLFSIGVVEETVSSEITDCDCQAPTEWSDCIDEEKTRTSYSCVDGICVSKTETTDCKIDQNIRQIFVNNIVIFIVLVLALVVLYFMLSRKTQ